MAGDAAGSSSSRLAVAVSMPYWLLPPLPYQEMIELYATSPASRDELVTDEPVERARRLLQEARGGSTSAA